MSSDDTDGEITFINRFTVHSSPEEFENEFSRTAAVMAEQPGFLGHTLLRHSEDPRSYVNVARWRSARSLREATARPEFERHARALRGLCTTEPAIYTPSQSIGRTS